MVPYADLVLPDTTYLERWDCISLLDRPISDADGPADAIRQPILDLDYAEDSEAGTDANFVMTGTNGLIEIQGSAECATFDRNEFNSLMDLAEKGVSELILAQKAAVS